MSVEVCSHGQQQQRSQQLVSATISRRSEIGSAPVCQPRRPNAWGAGHATWHCSFLQHMQPPDGVRWAQAAQTEGAGSDFVHFVVNAPPISRASLASSPSLLSSASTVLGPTSALARAQGPPTTRSIGSSGPARQETARSSGGQRHHHPHQELIRDSGWTKNQRPPAPPRAREIMRSTPLELVHQYGSS